MTREISLKLQGRSGFCLFLDSTCPLHSGTFLFQTFSVTVAGRRRDQQ